MTAPLVGIVMGSDSDWEVMQHAEPAGWPSSTCRTSAGSSARTARRTCCSATPRRRAGRGLRCIIAGAGGAAHLPGMLAAKTTLPVLGVPVPSTHLQGLDSLLSIVQMPAGVPVATFAIGAAGAHNAGLFAVAILALHRCRAGRGGSTRSARAQTERVLDAQAAGVARDPARRHRRRARRRPARPDVHAAGADDGLSRRGARSRPAQPGRARRRPPPPRRLRRRARARRAGRRRAPRSPPSSRTCRRRAARAPRRGHASCGRPSRRWPSPRTGSPRRRFLQRAGFATAPFRPVASAAELAGAPWPRSACPRCSRPAGWATTARARRRSTDAGVGVAPRSSASAAWPACWRSG